MNPLFFFDRPAAAARGVDGRGGGGGCGGGGGAAAAVPAARTALWTATTKAVTDGPIQSPRRLFL